MVLITSSLFVTSRYGFVSLTPPSAVLPVNVFIGGNSNSLPGWCRLMRSSGSVLSCGILLAGQVGRVQHECNMLHMLHSGLLIDEKCIGAGVAASAHSRGAQSHQHLLMGMYLKFTWGYHEK